MGSKISEKKKKPTLFPQSRQEKVKQNCELMEVFLT